LLQTLYAGDWNNEKTVPGIEDLEPKLQVPVTFILRLQKFKWKQHGSICFNGTIRFNGTGTIRFSRWFDLGIRDHRRPPRPKLSFSEGLRF
jgi:hypothetical protein